MARRAGAVGDGEGDVLEEFGRAEGDADVGEREKSHAEAYADLKRRQSDASTTFLMHSASPMVPTRR